MISVRRLQSLILTSFVLGALALPVQAQQRVQRIQIGELVQRLSDLEAEVVRLRVSPRNGGGGDVVRLDQFEQELRRLTGVIERLDFETRKQASENKRRFEAFEERLEALEEGDDEDFASFSPQVAAPIAPALPQENQSFETTGTYQPFPSNPAPYEPPAALSPQPAYNTAQPPVAAFTPSVDASSPSFGGLGPSADILYDDGLRLLNIGSFDQAGAKFEDLIDAHPQDPRAGQAQFWLGDMHFKLGRFEDAAAAFLDSFRTWPEGPKAPDSLLKLGMTLANIGKTEEACLSFKQVSARYPTAAPSLLRRAQIEGQRYQCGG